MKQNREHPVLALLVLFFIVGGITASVLATGATTGGRTSTLKSYGETIKGRHTSAQPVTASAELATTHTVEVPAPIQTPAATPEPFQAPEVPRIIESINLDGQTQAAIFTVCGEDPKLFAAIMAVGKVESEHTPNIIGDGGKCIGMMQINYAYHTERMKRMVFTDLTDPVQCAAVALDYMEELAQEFNTDTDSHVLYVAYNRGPTGARELFQQGIYSTAYTWNVMQWYDAYLSSMTGG